ncbi:MAG: phosphotransferase [Planctomycetes bacterium]|nr:phosphotransferase [Planctomycetota bacterium]
MVPKITATVPGRRPDVERWFRGELEGEVVKENSARTVWRVRGAGLYVKRFAPKLLRDRARREADLLGALARAGVPCPRPVATARDARGTYLVTEEIAGARDLYSLIAEGAPHVRRHLASVAALLRRLHDAGFEHQDLHAGNVLVRDDEMFVLDVHRARRGRLSAARRLGGVAFMAMSFSDMVPLTEVHRFFRAYGVRDRGGLLDLWERLRRLRHLHWGGREDRCVREGTGFGVRGDVYGRKGAGIDALPAATDGGDEAIERLPGGRFLKRSRAARRIWRNAHALSLRSIPTPRLDACGPGWVVGEWIDAPNLGDFVRERFPRMGRAERDAFLFALARAVRRMHARGACHRDLKSSNILVTERGFSFVDIDRVRFSEEVPEADRIFNLAQLNASVVGTATRADRLRFLHRYIGRDRELWLRRRDWVRRVMRATVARRHFWP